ncbi:pentapeptide repeat-containing protein [Vagococcus carniphilus]|uniref:Pentapeptide repeat-containing protein n=2 Tax=Vagococcus carniphilus TaxID=218144 RepID=A0A430AUE2_9ENTE|nr:pentapeptide repeat-containing protein [Vagococcus carniphilus]RSU11678.1 hypothetical protein CBF28_12010 [Vagococcus carniphilus]
MLKKRPLKGTQLMISYQNVTLKNKSFNNQNLSFSDFSNSILHSCDFSNCDLTHSNFSGATLSNCFFSRANVDQANFRHAILDTCKLDNLKNVQSALFLKMSCPEAGPFLAYKQCHNFRIVQLLIPKDAKRSSATNNTCRCSKAKVLTIKSIDLKTSYKEAVSLVDENFIYRVGEMAIADDYNEDRWVDSTHGIHFYMTWEEAIGYM